MYINRNQRTHLPRHGYTGESGIGYEGRGRQENAVREYALAVKFLDRNQLMDVKEKIGMTILGQMLFEDGEKKGMERGVE